MSSNHWALLESIQEKLNSFSDLPPEIMIAIADRIEEAISASSNTPLKAISNQLAGLFNKLIRLAPIDAVNAARGSAPIDASESAAYMLGQVSFAQLLAAQTAERRADDNFLAVTRDHCFQNYIKALLSNDRTGVELAEITGERTETVSRKLKRLRELGITDFRREGTRLPNFLTPAARAALSEAVMLPLPSVTLPKNELSDLYKVIPQAMQKLPTFSTTSSSHILH